MNTYTVKDIAEYCNIDKTTITHRMKVLGIVKDNRKSGKVLYFDEEEFESIINFKKSHYKRLYSSLIYSKKKIYIIEYFLSNKDNSSPEIASYFDVPESFVNATLTEYLENNSTILVSSKINLVDL
jgi:predicted DNA-binding protein YlxM (UPF0122 family)